MEERSAPKGCIKNTRGPWKVKKTAKDGQVVTKLRFPTESGRQNSKQRERQRRSVTRNIFAGLRLYGNYQLPKNADTNDLLKALCEEAGWHVEEDGTIYKKGTLSCSKMDSCQIYASVASKDQDFNIYDNYGRTTTVSSQSCEARDFLKSFSNS